jgi:hypothetical protein
MLLGSADTILTSSKGLLDPPFAADTAASTPRMAAVGDHGYNARESISGRELW